MLDTAKLKGRIIEKYGTQSEFAKVIKRTQVFVSYVLNGHSQLSQTEVIEWAKALDIEQDEIGKYFFALKLTNVTEG